MKRSHGGLLFAALFMLNGASAARSGVHFDPSQLKGPRAGGSNALLVLGTPHLSQLPATFKAENLSSLIERLRKWGPHAIAIEALSGPQCAFMRHYPERYKDTIESYCWDPVVAREETGLDVPAATAEAHRLLSSWPAAPDPTQRRRLAALFLAGGEPASALVQWLRLPAPERRSGDGLTEPLVGVLEKLRNKRNENTLIAAPLAAELGHERVYPMDDHTADSPTVDEKSYGEAIMKAWDNPATSKRKKMDEQLKLKLGSPAAVLSMYRSYHAPGMGKLIFNSDVGAALEEPSPQRFGRGYVGYWETRNLRMASNIREVVSLRPGSRTLVLVGLSHKWYLDAYLNQMHDVRIEDVHRVLR